MTIWTPGNDPLPLPDPPSARPPEPARRVLGIIDAETPPSVFLEGAATSSPCRVLGSYVPNSGDTVNVLVGDGDVLVLGPSGWPEPPTTPMLLFHGSNNVGGAGLITTAAGALGLNVISYDPVNIHPGGSSAFCTLPWDGWYTFEWHLVVSYVASVQVGAGPGAWVGAVNTGWVALADKTGSVNHTMILRGSTLPRRANAGDVVALTHFVSAGTLGIGGGFGRNNEFVIGWEGRPNPTA